MPASLRGLLTLILVFGSSLVLVGQDAAPSEPAVPVTADPDTKSAPEVLSPLEKEKRRKAQAALSAVAGIVVIGVAGLAAILIWGKRLRRILRSSPGPKPLRNEFWFLKPEKPPVRPSLPERNENAPPDSGPTGT
jgi:hypothetical protein